MATAAACKQQGNELLGQGRLEEAAACYRQALAQDAGYAEAHLNLGFVLKEQGRYDQAQAHLQQAVLLAPAMADGFYLLGGVAQHQGDLEGAATHFNQALAVKPDFEMACRDLCDLYGQSGQIEKARQLIEKSLAINPQWTDFYYFLGRLHAADGEWEQAIACFTRELALQPDYIEVHIALANALRSQDKLDDAIASYRRALALNPDLADVLGNLGTALEANGMINEAIASHQKALALMPDLAEVHYNLGIAFREKGKIDSAIECFQKAITLKPDFTQAYVNLGNAFQVLGMLEAVVDCYSKILSNKPDFLDAHNRLLFALSFDARCDANAYLAQAREYGSKVLAQATPFTSWPVCQPGQASSPLRIGMVSGDFKMHPVGIFLEAILAHLDPAQVGLVAYSMTSGEDSLTQRIKPRFTAWHDVRKTDDVTLARKIRDDGIHILVDLSGHTGENRLPLFAWQPAPVQVSWLGYWASTGVPGIDYLLADPMSVPPEHQHHFSERIWYLPDTRLCFTPPALSTQLATTQPPAVCNGYVTFACFQSRTKINTSVLAAWGRIFAALPQARLRLQSRQMTYPAARAELLDRLAKVGIGAHRVQLEEAMPRDAYLAAHAQVDLILDTFPYPGGTTTCEALWMGVPTMTLAGDTLLSRQGASLLSCAGLDDWIASDEEEYVSKAVAYAQDLAGLGRLREGLRAQVLASPLFDAPRFASHLQQAFQNMWREKTK